MTRASTQDLRSTLSTLPGRLTPCASRACFAHDGSRDVGYDFEWNADKSASNRRKHGVTFEEATTAFADPRSLNQFDPDHSVDEDRYILLGKSQFGRILVVSYTDRPPRTRIISARLATRRERNQYEQP